LDLDTHNADAPLVSGLVEDLPEVQVDGVAAGEGLVELHLADQVSQVGLGQLGDGEDEVADVVDQPLRVGGLVVDDGVDGHHDVVLGDDLLRGDVDDLLAHVDHPHRLDERDDQLETGVDRLLELAELLHDAALIGPDDAYAARDVHEEEEGDDRQEDYQRGHSECSLLGVTTMRVPSTSVIRTSLPAGMTVRSTLTARHSSWSTRTVPGSLGEMSSSTRPERPMRRREPTPEDAPSLSRLSLRAMGRRAMNEAREMPTKAAHS